ncbi:MULTISPECIES: hypothetical protein [unclassified Nocardioides]|uniref:hypothetical protein n=1 Tax=unclassified Nocardioides TaxID=2615069 RepID=UPI000703BB45|nr:MULTISPECIES: hypothetical protein [unclassified Nocardioides]KQP64921.1 hypothetical protein ASF47_13795 [Nocardioides sp. Leaf285]KQQ43942.1 hypothetical protein ASF50_08855 [Nocardioides sp. Leaf307]
MTESNEKTEAVQAVVDRVTSYQESAPEGTVEAELRKGLGEAGLDLPDADVTALAEAIEAAEEGDGPVQAASVLS